MLAALREKLMRSLKRQEECYRAIVSELAAHGIFLRKWDDLTPAQREEADQYFDSQVSPALTPLVFDPAHAFPFLSNLSTSLAFILYDEEELMYARVKVPGVVKQWVALETGVKPGERLLLPLYEIIRGNAHKLYGGMRLTGTTLFRLTRDAEIEIDDDTDEALQDVVREQVRQRRYEPVVRLDFAPGADPSIREMLCQRFNLTPLDVYDLPGEIDYTTLFEIASLPIPALRDLPWNPLAVAAIENHEDIFAAMRTGDILLHHPYESFEASVEHFIAAAADDPQTVSIKMTAYRIGDDTPFVKSLIKAAEAGKQVACVIEIKARFDEERNLHWAAELERAGAHVTFGVPGLKTHAKLALVVRKESFGLKLYVHIGTGNYHTRTARLYSDIGLLTCNPSITREVVNLFHYLTGNSRAPVFTQLLLAPGSMRARFLQLIKREIDNQRVNLPARIVAKMNQLEDPELAEILCEAAAAGVQMDLIVRGFCCMKPRRRGPHRRHSHPFDHWSISGTFPYFPLRGRAGEPARRRLLHRLGGLDVPQPFQTSGSGDTHFGARGEGEAVGDSRHRLARSAPGLDTAKRRDLCSTAPRRRHRKPGGSRDTSNINGSRSQEIQRIGMRRNLFVN